MASQWRQRVIKLVQIAIATAAWLWLLSQLDFDRTLSLFAGVGTIVPVALAIVTALEFGSRFSMWYVLLNVINSTRFRTAATIDVLIKFINHLIPSKASGHSIAPIVLHHFTDHDWAESLAIAALNTGFYATLYSVVAVIGLGIFVFDLPFGLLAVIGLSTGLYLLIGGTILTIGRRIGATSGLMERLLPSLTGVPLAGEFLDRFLSALPSLAADSSRTFRSLSARREVVGFYTVAWLGTLMIFPGLRVGILLSAFGAPFEPLFLLPFVLVMAYSVTILPITPGGVGIAEASAVIVFVALGIPEEVAISVVFLDRLLGVYLPAALGWYPATKIDITALVSTAPVGDS